MSLSNFGPREDPRGADTPALERWVGALAMAVIGLAAVAVLVV